MGANPMVPMALQYGFACKIGEKEFAMAEIIEISRLALHDQVAARLWPGAGVAVLQPLWIRPRAD